ncbi:MAG: DUF1549 and DUF1553 domain-containing protein, partial [Chthonomonadales bacterium]
PRYGEKWGRKWLDIARYCDSPDQRGLGSEGDTLDAWRYRDWVIGAYNSDMPYDKFILNQIAGDVLPDNDPIPAKREGIIATTFLAIGNWGNGDADKEKIYTDIVDDQIDAVSRGFLGLTVACARCHDHKFDPISTKDYYALAGIFFSTRILAKFTPKGQGEVPMRVALPKLANAVATAPAEFANGVIDGGIPGTGWEGFHDSKVHIRGNYARLGDLVTRRVPEVIAGPNPPKIEKGSGRVELARWIANPSNPLTARVMVNRIWQGHFGDGIVRTPGNFGFLGERPTNPGLLDYLANEFVKSGWSSKSMHRLIMNSQAYRQSNVATPLARKVDADNRLFSRYSRRRLEAEELRDSLLSAAGTLDSKSGGPAAREANSPRRAVYCITIRSDRSGFGPLFDMADSTALADHRNSATVAPQALYLMNNPFVTTAAQKLAERTFPKVREDNGAVLSELYGSLFGRPISSKELSLARSFLERGVGEPMRKRLWERYCRTMLCTNEFLFVD